MDWMVVCYPDFIKFLQYMLLLDIHFKVVMLHFTHFGIGCFGSQTDIDNSCQTIPKNVLSYYGNRTPSYKTWWKFNVLLCFICWLTKPVSAESAVLLSSLSESVNELTFSHMKLYILFGIGNLLAKERFASCHWVCIIGLTLWLGDTLAFNLLYWGCHWNALDTMDRFLLHVGNKTIQ